MATLKTFMENTLFHKLAYAVAASAMIGGGTMVLNNQARIAVLENVRQIDDQRLARIEDKLDMVLLQTAKNYRAP